jgi:hypothetical protein
VRNFHCREEFPAHRAGNYFLLKGEGWKLLPPERRRLEITSS